LEREPNVIEWEMPDPRGIGGEQPADPAPRLAGLRGAQLLLVDNGKLAPIYQSLSSIPRSLFALFSECRWTTFSRDFLRYHHSQLSEVVEEIAALAPDAAVFALADAGVSVQTMLIAAGLETRGIPTVVLATTLGEPACKSIAATRLPGLPVVLLDVARSDSPEQIDALLAETKPAIASALTSKPDGVSTNPAGSGHLSFVPKSEGWLMMHEFQDWLAANDLGDGLPLLPPVPELVDGLLATVPFDPDEIIYHSALTSGRSLRVRDAAANAVMTGCPAPAFPVVAAALRAMSRPDFRLLQAVITTHPSGYFVLLSGCDPAQFGLSGGPGCLGPGHRGNLSVGRAISLSVQHLFGARPGGADLTSFGSPAEIAYCMAEETGGLPWPTLASERGFDGPAVFVVKAEGPRNVLEHLLVTPRALCEAIASGATSLCANNAYVPGDLVIMLNPEHAKIFTDAGWRRDDIALAIHHAARLPRQRLEARGADPFRPAYMDALDELPVTRSAADIQVVIGGAPGPHSLVALPWGYSRGQWMQVSAR
jgi:hypothetical protein